MQQENKQPLWIVACKAAALLAVIVFLAVYLSVPEERFKEEALWSKIISASLWIQGITLAIVLLYHSRQKKRRKAEIKEYGQDGQDA